MISRLATPSLRPTTSLRAGKSIFDCSGAIHRQWIETAIARHLNVVVYRRDFHVDDLAEIPPAATVQTVSGELFEVLGRTRDSVHLLVDDLGALHFHDQPLELLRRYYDSLAWDGEAWLRFPETFWVFLEDQHRVSLSDYLVMKFPSLARHLRPGDLDPALNAQGTSGWVLLKKSRQFPKLFFHLNMRSVGGTSYPAGQPHAPYLEFVEKTQTPKTLPPLWMRRAG